jgi:uncharacterized protein with gpF-like domain
MAVYIDPQQEQAAIADLRQKALRIGFDYRDVWYGLHSTKTTELDLLVDTCAAADEVLATDNTLQAFLETLAPHLIKRGWGNKTKATNPETGASLLAEFSSPACLKVLYDTNLRIASTEGQWQRIQSAKIGLPYLLYDYIPCAHEPPEHAAWDGLVLPVDDPWWQRHLPVKAWGCMCRVIQLGDRQLQRLGATPGHAPPEIYGEYTNPRTGESQKVPMGVDPAFNFPPGSRAG